MKFLYNIILITLMFTCNTGFSIKLDTDTSIKYITLDVSITNSRNQFDSLNVFQYDFDMIYQTSIKKREDLQKESQTYIFSYIYSCSRARIIYIPYKYNQTFMISLNDTLFNGDYIESIVKSYGGLRVYSSEILLKEPDYYKEWIVIRIHTEEKLDTSSKYKSYTYITKEDVEEKDKDKNKQYIKKTTISGDTLYINLFIDLDKTSVIRY